MANITVFGSAMGTSFRVHWALHELGLPYETKKLDFASGEHKSPAFLEMNPMGQIPVIKVDEFVLPESLAITEYLVGKFNPALFGATLEDRAQVTRWSIWNMLNLNSAFSKLASVKWGGVVTPEMDAEKRAELGKNLPVLEAQLAGKEFIIGGFSLADINVRSTFTYGEMIGFDFSAYPNISAWLARTAAMPSFIAAKG